MSMKIGRNMSLIHLKASTNTTPCPEDSSLVLWHYYHWQLENEPVKTKYLSRNPDKRVTSLYAVSAELQIVCKWNTFLRILRKQTNTFKLQKRTPLKNHLQYQSKVSKKEQFFFTSTMKEVRFHCFISKKLQNHSQTEEGWTNLSQVHEETTSHGHTHSKQHQAQREQLP